MTDTTNQIDNGDETVDVSGNELDNRSQMLATTALFVQQVIKAEATIGETAKTLGHNVFRAVYVDNANLDALIGDMKVAASWPTIATSEGGRKAKQRMEVNFSGFRLVAERWASLTDEQRNAVLEGESSVLYLASQMRKADAEAKKAAAAAEKAAEATATASPEEVPASSLEDDVMALLERYQASTPEQRNAAYDALALLFETVNGDADVVEQPQEAEAATA